MIHDFVLLFTAEVDSALVIARVPGDITSYDTVSMQYNGNHALLHPIDKDCLKPK